MNNYLFSIICPCYNSEKFIAQSINSVLKQKYSNWELIIVDDGSNDDSLKIIKSFVDNKIKVFSKINEGAFIARNFALNKISGDYFLFLDSDDELAENYLQIANLYLNKYHCDVCCFGMKKEECGSFRRVFQRLENQTLLTSNKEILLYSYIDVKLFEGLIPKVFKTSLFSKNINNHNLRKGEDYLQGFEFLKHATTLLSINEIVYTYHENFSSLSHNWNHNIEFDFIFKCKKIMFDNLFSISQFSTNELNKFLDETNILLSYFIRTVFKDKSLTYKQKKIIVKSIYKEEFYKILKTRFKNTKHFSSKIFLLNFRLRCHFINHIFSKIVSY